MLAQFFSGHNLQIIPGLLLMSYDHFAAVFLCVQDRLVHCHQRP